mgnify:FL=1
MFEKILYVFGFLIFTLLLQWILYKIRRNHNRGDSAIWVGYGAIVVICVMGGVISNNVNYFSSIIGFVIGDKIGEKEGWH